MQFFWKGDVRECAQDLVPKAEAIGGRLDGESTGLLVFTIPVSTGFPAIERIFYEAEKRYAGCQWMYGNVYDPANRETQLDWWKQT